MTRREGLFAAVVFRIRDNVHQDEASISVGGENPHTGEELRGD